MKKAAWIELQGRDMIWAEEITYNDSVVKEWDTLWEGHRALLFGGVRMLIHSESDVGRVNPALG